MALAMGMAAGLPSLAALRCFAAEHANERVTRALAARKPVAYVDAWVRRAHALAPECGRPLALRGQAFALWAAQEKNGAREAIAGMAAVDLNAAARLVPAEPAVFAGAARAAVLGPSPVPAWRYAHEAVLRRPGFAEYTWAWARALPPGLPERKRAYRRLTQIAPPLTPHVLAEAAPGKSPERQRSYVAPRAAAYRAWAWSLTDTTLALRVARWGLAQPQRAGDGLERGQLAYLVALKTAERDPAAALSWYRLATKTLGDEQAVQRNYGFALLRAGDAAAAQRAFEASLRLQPGLANPAHLGLGQAREAQGQGAEALRIYRRLQRQPHVEAWVRQQAGDGVYRLERKG